MSPGRQIIEELSAELDIPVKVLLRPRGPKEVVEARWEAMYRMRRRARLSTPCIGRELGLDHATVLYGLRQYMARARLDVGAIVWAGAGL